MRVWICSKGKKNSMFCKCCLMSLEIRLISEKEVGDPGDTRGGERTRLTVVAEEPLGFLFLHSEEGPHEVVNDGPQEDD